MLVSEIMEIFDLKNKQEYLNEVMELELIEWSSKSILDKPKQIKKNQKIS